MYNLFDIDRQDADVTHEVLFEGPFLLGKIT